MKRLLLNLLCLLFAYPCFAAEPIQLARMNPWVAGSNYQSSASCTTSNDSAIVDYLDDGSDSQSNIIYTATKWVLTQNITVTFYKSRLFASTAGGIRLCLMGHDAENDLPDFTCITGSDKYLAHDAIADTLTNTDFELDTPKNIDAGTYWIVSIAEGGVTKSQAYHALTGGRVHYYSSSPPGISEDDYVYDMEVWGCTR